MKKILTLAAMMLLAVMGQSACTAKTNKANGRSSESHQARLNGRVVTDEGEANKEAGESTNETTKKMTSLKGKKTLVAYFSWSGNTKEAAHYIAQKAGADEFEIIREKMPRLRKKQASVLPSKERLKTWHSMTWCLSASLYGGTRLRCPSSHS